MELAQLIDALSDPSAYSQQPDGVEVHQTHISVVFLAGELAYKIKKPVTLGFVDYGTLERRHHFCEEEVRLNRRLAPEVYLGVVPVTLESGSIQMDGTGEVVDWAVKMRRLPDSSTLRAHLAGGGLAAEALTEWAGRLARFHALAESGTRVAAHGSLEAIDRNARDNLEEATPQVGVTLSRATLDRLGERTETVLSRLGHLIEHRARRGLPRDTHGDLRLDHVYWFPDRAPPGNWIAVDCIEFDDRFRHADPIADIAFLAMELSLEGRGDLAASFVEDYLHASGDEEGRALLPFYRAYRAAVRGKVEGLKMTEPEIPETDRAAARSRARALWLFALSKLEEPQRRPCLILVAGLPGSGKSTLCRALAERAGFTVIRSDEIRKQLADASAGADSPPHAFGNGLYTPGWNERTHAECLRHAEELLFEGRRVLIDASFREDARRRLFLDAARRWGITSCLILCRADPDIVRARLDHRRGDASDADWAIYQQAARQWEELSPPVRQVTRSLDTGGSREQSLAQAFRIVQECDRLDPAG
jgi:aminoglycoside phosphotransferase family enzyme/predicted kinase